MPTAAHHRARVLATVGAAGAHAALAVLGSTDLLNYTVPTRFALIDMAAAEFAWTWAHLIAAALLVGSLYRPLYRPMAYGWTSSIPVAGLACNIAFAVMISWAILNLLWGLSTIRPVSLAGPVLAFAVAAGEQLLANAWTRGSHTKVR